MLDTHILIWWVTNSGSLSSPAEKKIKKTLDNDEEIIVSSISIWEISMLIQKGRLSFSMDIENWTQEITEIDGIRFVPVNNEIFIKSTMLPGNFHKDPADRIIVATARKFAAPLLTADEKILNYPHVKTIW